MSDVLGTLKRLFPNVRVTSGYRGPNHPLTRKNPRSWHAQGSPDAPRAIDIAPIPGVSFDQYLSKLKGSGLNVVEARDEVNNPSSHATGPHWHAAFGDKKVPQSNYGGYGGRPKLPADLEQRAAAFGQGMIPPQPQMAPPQMQQPIATQAILGNLAPEKKPETGLFKGNDIAAVLGILGDSLMAYGGMQPTFGPGVARREEAAAQRELEERKLAMQAQPKTPSFIENARALAGLPAHERAIVAAYQDLMNPVVADTQDENGRVIRQTFPRRVGPMPGTVEDGHMFIGGDPSDKANWRAM